MNKIAVVAVASWMLAVAAPYASGQAWERDALGTAELRVGSLWHKSETVPAQAFTLFSMGGRIAPYLGRGRVTHRFSVQFAADFCPVSTTDFFDTTLNSQARLSEYLVILNPALGVDVIQSPQVSLTLRYGGAVFGDLTRFELPDIYGQYEDVCHLAAFSSACPSQWTFLGNVGAGLRFRPKRHRSFYFGVDFTRYAGARKQLMGTFGRYF